jgi:hypothetical protein
MARILGILTALSLAILTIGSGGCASEKIDSPGSQHGE